MYILVVSGCNEIMHKQAMPSPVYVHIDFMYARALMKNTPLSQLRAVEASC
jgi:hypothetical protein